MPYREIRLGFETFVVRVPTAAVTEWLDNRERGKYIGYPDRPPDVDTPLVRGWIQHPDESDKFNYLASTVGDQETFPVYSISCEAQSPISDLVIDAKFLVSCNPSNDKYALRLVLRTLEGKSIADSEFEIDSSRIEPVFDSKLEQYAEAFISKTTVPFVSTYSDYENLMEETSIAEKELKEYYGNSDSKLVN
jgi:hypothetical protein